MQLTILDTVNDPGTPGKTGDDRVGFDASAGTAWVLDGATDVTNLRPFNRAESGAAWVAQALSDRLIIAPHEGETVEAYFEDVLTDVRQRATKETRLPLDSLPGEALPIASGIWMHLEDDTATFAWLGDCMGFHQRGSVVTVIGSPDKADDETDVARSCWQARLKRRWPICRRHGGRRMRPAERLALIRARRRTCTRKRSPCRRATGSA